ncbi:MAG: metal ABC transporter permease [Acidobacteria bacterium]|nr:metal ABC transporter permease [Acidobacteriota bacterium]
MFRKQFLAISTGKATGSVSGMSVRFWDLLFYASFGIVVTSSVSVAGVLLVFYYLIVPAVGGMLFSEKIGIRLMIGWAMGVFVSALGMFASLELDLPTGPAIVCTFAIVLAAMAVAKLMIGASRPGSSTTV